MQVESASVDAEGLIKELEWTIDLQEAIRKDPKKNLQDYVRNDRGEGSITASMTRCGLLEDLCRRLLDASLIKHDDLDIIDVDQNMLEACEQTTQGFATAAQFLFEQEGRRVLAYKERYLLELLGANVYDTAMRRRQSVSSATMKRG
jgi:dihydroneopterin aldolase